MAVSAGLVCFFIYIITLHPSVGFIDCGELAAACYTFGVPHPTGYPLFLLIGFVFSHLPLPGTVIYKLNLLSAVESSAAVVVTFYSALIIVENLLPVFLKSKGRSKGVKKESHESAAVSSINICLIAFFTAVLTGLTKTYWFEATQVEVYSLHSLFIAILFYYSIRILFCLKELPRKNWTFLFLFFGLSAANHSTTIYFIPGIIYLYYLQFKQSRTFAKPLLLYLFLLLPGAMLYLILMLAASSEPYLNWSNPVNISNLINHLRGSDFSQLMFSSGNNFSANASTFFKNLPGELAILPGVIGLLGIASLWNANRMLFSFLLILILTSLLYSFNYSTIEIQSFYLLVYYIIILFVSLGALFFLNIAGKMNLLLKPGLQPALLIFGAIISAFAIGFNFNENNNSTNYVNEDITLNTLTSLEPNSILLTYDYAFVYSSSLYYQQVEKLRPDVKVFIIKFLAAPWYLDMIKKYYPDVYENIKTEAEEYVRFYSGDEKSRVLKLTALVKAFLNKNYGKFPVYLTVDFIVSKDLKKFLTGYYLQPDGLVYKLREPNAQYDSSTGIRSLNAPFRKYEPIGYHKNKMYISTPGVLFETAYYHYSNKNFDLAEKFLDKVLELNSGFTEAVNLKNKIFSERK
ncbi:MAG: DUF2723 domain-containing protein [Chlorobi bacterium]|nr:DUF2723 domain-containing protein [Chlorobiota bacterium]MCI0716858.1 DUF2723 domain-containing protein [Chlorobiota bacterium]